MDVGSSKVGEVHENVPIREHSPSPSVIIEGIVRDLNQRGTAAAVAPPASSAGIDVGLSEKEAITPPPASGIGFNVGVTHLVTPSSKETTIVPPASGAGFNVDMAHLANPPCEGTAIVPPASEAENNEIEQELIDLEAQRARLVREKEMIAVSSQSLEMEINQMKTGRLKSLTELAAIVPDPQKALSSTFAFFLPLP